MQQIYISFRFCAKNELYGQKAFEAYQVDSREKKKKNLPAGGRKNKAVLVKQ